MNKIIIKNFLFLFFFLSSTQLWGAINKPPMADTQNVITNEDTPINMILNGSDPEGSSLTYSIVYSTTRGSLSGSGNIWTYTPTANFNGTDFFKFRVSDGNRWSRLATVTISVTPVNDTPSISDGTYTLNEDYTGTNIRPTTNDVDGDTLSLKIVSQPSFGTAAINEDTINYIPNANTNGSDSFTVVASDGTLSSSPATISLTITPINDNPVAVSQDVTTDEDMPITVTLANDVDGDPITATIGYASGHGTLLVSESTITYTPNADFYGLDAFTYRAFDGTLYSNDTATVNITVNSVNDPPTVNNTSLEVIAGNSAVITLYGSDVEDSELNFLLVDQPAAGTASIAGNILTFKAANNSIGEDSLTFVASDGETNSALGTVSINITNPDITVPVETSYLEAMTDVIITKNSDITVVKMPYTDCQAFSATPLVLPLSNGSEAIVGTFYSKCGNYVDVPKGLFLVQSDTGAVFRFTSEGDLNPNASGTGFFERQAGSIWMAVENTSVNSEDPDEPTGGLVRWNSETEYFDNWEGRGTESLINLDGNILTSTLNTDKTTCQNGRKIHAELCGLLTLVDANSGDMVDMTSSSGEGGDDYEASPAAAPTRAIFQEGNYDRTVWGTSRGGNLYDASLDVGGSCRVFMADTQYLLDTGFNGELVDFDFFADNLDFGAISDDPGDPGCIADNNITTNYSAIEGEVAISLDSSTKLPTYWAKEHFPGITGSNETNIIHYDQDLNVICEATVNSGAGKTPFSGDGMVVDRYGIAYTSATYFDSNNVRRTGIWTVDPNCSVTKLIELNYAAIGNNPFSGVTLAVDAQGEDWVLGSAAGFLYAYNLNTKQYTTHTLGSSSTDLVIAAPVVDSSGRVIVMSVNNIMTIFNNFKNSQGDEMHFSYGDHLWPRFRKDNFGSGTLEIIVK